MKTLVLMAAGMVLGAFGSPYDFADPFVGTSGTGHTHPGARVPFGMVHAGPDTGTADWHYCGGYRYEDERIFGFSQTHLPSGGCTDLGDALILPFAGELGGDFREQINKRTEKACGGYYAVKLQTSDVFAEVTATSHAALYRFRYGADRPARLLLDGQWVCSSRGARPPKMVLEEKIELVGDRRVDGWRKTHGWCRPRSVGFVLEFDRPFVGHRLLERRDPREKGERHVFDFDLRPGETLMVKVAVSRNDAAAARLNLAAEIPDWDFDAVRGRAEKAWRDVLGLTIAEGTEEQKRNWYSSLYHLCCQPQVWSDVDEPLRYSAFSCWDTFRAAAPLYTILMPDVNLTFVDSLLAQGRDNGYLPIWPLWGYETQAMIGTHSVPMIVDVFLKETGAARSREYWEEAYGQIRQTLTERHAGRKKENWDLYDRYGYYPYDLIRGESVSRTMECSYDDWCAAQMARRLGKGADAAFFLKRADRWRNVFDPEIGFVRGKDTAGKWRTPYDPFKIGHGADTANDFTEGNAYQYTWHVLQDPFGLIEAMGGKDRFVGRLDALFTAPERIDGAGRVADVTGLVGQYVHGNEPSHHVLYFYTLAGRPDRAAELIRLVTDRFYRPTPDGLCGNEDCGQMSAWYLFSALGFYPFNPCGGEYVIGAPQLPRVEIEVGRRGGQRKTFRVVAKGLSKENKYVKSVTLNGKPVTDWKIRHEDVMKGGELIFEMSPEPWDGKRRR